MRWRTPPAFLRLFLISGMFFNTVDDLIGASAFTATELKVPKAGTIGFRKTNPSLTGLMFTNTLSSNRSITNQIYLNGSGVAAGDVNGDGLCDLYFCGLDTPNSLYLNQGNWKFSPSDSPSIALENAASTSAAFADLDGDGDLDLLVSTIRNGCFAFANDGSGHWKPIPNPELEANKAGAMSMAIADSDGDGDLDLYVTNYRTSTLRDEPLTRFRVSPVNGTNRIIEVDGRPVTEPDLVGRFELGPENQVIEAGEPDAFFENDGKGHFTRIPLDSDVFQVAKGMLSTELRDWGLSAMFRDMNQDGAPDLYVCNDFESPDRIWINDGKGRFREINSKAIRKTSLFSMGIDFADINRDGHDDFVVLDMLSRSHVRRQVQVGDIKPGMGRDLTLRDQEQTPRNTLMLNRGDETYAEIALYAGLHASEWSWCPVFLDVDLDGYEDLLITNGHERDAMNIDVARSIESRREGKTDSRSDILNLRRAFPKLETSNLAFRNQGDLTFQEMTKEWSFNAEEVSHGMALADLDNDGDLDVAINHLNAVAILYENTTPAPRLRVQLKSSSGNTFGIGARILVHNGDLIQSQEIIAGGRYLSSDAPVRTFAVPGTQEAIRIEVLWRDGTKSVVRDAMANHSYVIAKEESEPSRSDFTTARRKPMFKETSGLLNHRPHDSEHDGFHPQTGLPYRLDTCAPVVEELDWNKDGWKDLVITGGQSHGPSLFINRNGKTFSELEELKKRLPSWPEQTCVLAINPLKKADPTHLMIGFANSSSPTGNRGLLHLRSDSPNTLRWLEVPVQSFVCGALAASDIDQDGDIDLFAGGHFVPNNFPKPADSFLFVNQEGVFRPDATASKAFEKVGMVTGAVFADLDADGDPDLVLARHWDPPAIFINKQGEFEDQTEKFGLQNYQGLWNGVATSDLNHDGRPDLVFSNMGRNTYFQPHLHHPIRLYYGDLNSDGITEVIQSHFDEELDQWVPSYRFDEVARIIPPARQMFSSYEEFGRASINQVFGPWLALTQVKEVHVLDTTVFLHRGDTFDPIPLPLETQLAPAFSLATDDVNKDGHQDLFLVQNFFGTRPGQARYDAGRGLLLLGNGDGTFQSVPARESGIEVYGEQRGALFTDLNQDGHSDLVIGRNGRETKLYLHQGRHSN